MATISIQKLLAVAILGAVVLFLGSVVVILQFIVVQRRQLHLRRNKHRSTGKQAHSETISPSNRVSENELYLWKQYAHIPSDTESAAKAYWNQAAAALAEWDATLENNFFAAGDDVNHTHALYSLQQASQLGNADAQYHMANALSSGVWPIEVEDDESTATTDKLIVQDDMFSTVDSQSIQAQLLWHMSAMDGHVDSSIALGYRRKEECSAALPYYEAAAHLIMDQLEASTSRAKVHPPFDKHVLAQVHMHGGTSSSLKMHNKPDESAEALQYYHLRATGTAADLGAAYTLAHYYHHGLRGVQQNMTLALEYYEIAANAHHWEASAQTGMFYFWGFGCKRDLAKAHKYFRKGAPFGLEGCTKRWRNSKKTKEETTTCDATALDGMGLVNLFGIPHLIPVDFDKARRYFKLAKQMGNGDASYNLAMMDLGHKEHFVNPEEVEEKQGQTLVDPLVPSSYQKPYKGPSKNTIANAVNDLVVAASKGHLQARHRLGIMYSHGLTLENVDGNDQQVIIKDCNKAFMHYKFITDLASPSLSQRTRKAYKQYMAGDYENSLRNYLAAAETGSELGQINAAFLLEQKTCLGLSELDCARASVRLWKAAAKQGNAEACLRVGDFYYYGRLRQEQDEPISPIGPILWLQYVVYPERMLPFVRNAIGRAIQWVAMKNNVEKEEKNTSEEAPVCDAGESTDGTCLVAAATKEDEQQSLVESDLAMAAHYYRIAAEQHKNPRANFNLGFMHEWGLGLKQDFPLAKRHYDLASPESSNTREGEVPVQIALTLLNMHENLVKLKHAWDERWLQKEQVGDNTQVPKAADAGVGHPVPGKKQQDVGSATRADVIISHIVSWESLLIILLTIVLSKLVQHRRTRPR